MHEFALSQNLVDSVLAEMDRMPAAYRLLAVVVRIGRLRQVVEETLRFSFELLARDTRVQGARLEIETVPLTAACQACGRQGEIDATAFYCPVCGSTRLELKTGMELHLDRLEIDDE